MEPDTSITPPTDLAQTRASQLRVVRSTFKGEPYVDVRTWWRNSAGEWLPSRKGVAIRLTEVPGVADAMRRA